MFALLILAVIAVLIIPPLLSKKAVTTIGYQKFMKTELPQHLVKTVNLNNETGVITGQLKTGVDYSVNGPNPAIESEINVLTNDVARGTSRRPPPRRASSRNGCRRSSSSS